MTPWKRTPPLIFLMVHTSLLHYLQHLGPFRQEVNGVKTRWIRLMDFVFICAVFHCETRCNLLHCCSLQPSNNKTDFTLKLKLWWTKCTYSWNTCILNNASSSGYYIIIFLFLHTSIVWDTIGTGKSFLGCQTNNLAILAWTGQAAVQEALLVKHVLYERLLNGRSLKCQASNKRNGKYSAHSRAHLKKCKRDWRRCQEMATKC